MNLFKPKIRDDAKIELATVNDRAIAFLIDYGLIYIINLILLIVWKDDKSYLITLQSISILPLLSYKIIIESITGTTIGKRILNLVVIDNSRLKPSLKAIFKRHVFYLVFASIAITYIIMFKVAVINNFMYSHFSIKLINIIALVLSKYVIYLFAFLDLVSITKDPEEQNRSIHDRFAETLVVKINSR